MGILERIVTQKRAELSAMRSAALPPPPPRRPLALRRNPTEPLRIIAEIKRRSPSAGQLSTHLSAAERARAYQRAGASMVSVLCDSTFFGGSYADLASVREACSLPLLCKEFILDPVQLDFARAHGADAVLLIVRCLKDDELGALLTAARDLGLQALVEVASEQEAERALSAGATLVGVNARDLDTLRVDVGRAQAILASLPAPVVRVHLSGLRDAADVTALGRTSADAALVGEALMRRDDPEPLLRDMIRAAAPC